MLIPNAVAESNYDAVNIIPEEVTVIEFEQFNLVRVHLTVTNNDQETFEPFYSYFVTGSTLPELSIYERETIDEVGSKTCPSFWSIEVSAGTTEDYIICYKTSKKPLDVYWLQVQSSDIDYCAEYPQYCQQKNYNLYQYVTPEYTDYESYKKKFIIPLSAISVKITNFGLDENADFNILFATVSITNESNEEYNFRPSDIKAENDKGQKFSHDLRLFSDCDSGWLELNPGLTKSAGYCFEIPKGEYEFDIVIRANFPYSENCDSQHADCEEMRTSINVEPTSAAPPPAAPTPAQQAGDGCGPGTVLVNGVCELAPTPAQQAGGGCGSGTVLVNGVCELAKTSAAEDFDTDGSSFFNVMAGIFIFFIFSVIAIIIIIIIIAILIKRRKTTRKPAKQDLEEYEEKYLAKEKPAMQKSAEKKETSMFCDNCGAAFKKSEAKFCGECGTQRS